MKNYLLSILLAPGDSGALENNAQDFSNNLRQLINVGIGWIMGILAVLVVGWSIFIGIKWASAKRSEQREEAKSYLKQFIVGIVLIFVLAVGVPLLISGLATWAGISIMA